MRSIIRIRLDSSILASLRALQANADKKRALGTLEIQKKWNTSRKSIGVAGAYAILKKMAGPAERCMYCQDSHASDIEHFWPKAIFPERMYRWENLLLCCAECGRIKGAKFPLDATGDPLLIDPTSENPWEFIDYVPETGRMTARYIPANANYSVRGEVTVRTLRLDSREVLCKIYVRANRDLLRQIASLLEEPVADAATSASELIAQDHAGLLGWYMTGTGRNEALIRRLRDERPDVWSALVQTYADPWAGSSEPGRGTD